jgi:hypothetical protein
MRKMPAALRVERSNSSIEPSRVALGGPFSESTASSGAGDLVHGSSVRVHHKQCAVAVASLKKRRNTIFPGRPEPAAAAFPAAGWPAVVWPLDPQPTVAATAAITSVMVSAREVILGTPHSRS